MSTVAETISIARRCLDDEGLRFALVGGFAVSARSEPRFTRDVDLAVAVADDAQAEATVRRLVAEGHELLATVEISRPISAASSGMPPEGTRGSAGAPHATIGS